MNRALRIRPGTMPPTSRPEIEMPARLPNSTARPDGGIRMSTPPIARIGPIAVLGSYLRSSICGNSSEPSIAVVDRFHRQAGVEQHFAHQHKERNRHERKLRDRQLLVADHLLQARQAA